MPHAKIDAIRQHALDGFSATVDKLNGYLRVPAISCEQEHFGDVRKLAGLIRDDVEKLGFDKARVLEVEGGLPIVAAERMNAGDDKPTVLIYGHLDLQPVAGEPWDTDPHEPVEKDGRLYARGSADDMGGWVSHMAALQSWLEVNGELPVNVKLIIEGEEEIGSPNLARYMDEYPEVFAADVMVLTDCENPSTEIPGLTVSLRGLYEIDVRVDALENDVHSGLWGNMAPDANVCLMKLLSRLVDDDGRLQIGRQKVDEAWRKAAWDVPLGPEVVREGAGVVEGVEPLPDRGTAPAEWVWRQPAVTILSTTMPAPGREKNALRSSATAALSFRVAPGQTHEELKSLLEDTLLTHPPGGVKVTITERPARADSWLYEPSGPAFDAADRAYERAWGHKLLQVGVGGSIPFVALFGQRFGDLPLILNGVMDPRTGAHGPNESMDLEVFKKAILANVHLYDELGRTAALKA